MKYLLSFLSKNCKRCNLQYEAQRKRGAFSMKQSTKTTNRAFMHNNIPYRYCYEEGGMIEIEKDIYREAS